MGQGHLLTFGTSLFLFGYPETLTQLLLQRSGLSKQGQSTRPAVGHPCVRTPKSAGTPGSFFYNAAIKPRSPFKCTLITCSLNTAGQEVGVLIQTQSPSSLEEVTC